MFEIRPTKIPGCLEILPTIFQDQRGVFVKTFHQEEFAKLGLTINFAEEFYSFSNSGVLRGLHFQAPPHDHLKLVYCLQGKAFDVAVDLRSGSPTYGQCATFELDPKKGSMIYIPSGLAHGFYALEDNTLMAYKATTVYSPECDTGIRWDSVGIAWPNSNPVVSERDCKFDKFDEFETPFIYERP
jgi:dTDP-4-dehydrorhamnose 3,5-epimerase